MGTPDEINSATSELENASEAANTAAKEVNWEKRYKDTQASYTKARQELAALKAQLQVQNTSQIDPKVQEELEDLKYSNPDEWRKKLGQIEQEREAKLAEETRKLTELERRQLVFEEFRINHPDVHIDDDVLTYDVPRRITKKLEENKITFEEFLGEVYDYLKTPKVIGSGAKPINQPNLSKFGGGDSPTKDATGKDIVSSYKKEIY